MKAHDPLYDEDSVTLIKSTNGRVLTIPTLGDVSNVAEVIGEAVQDSSTDIANVGQALVGAYSYRTPRYTASIEAFQDVESAGGLAQMFENFAADRLARGISADLVNGTGADVKPLGSGSFGHRVGFHGHANHHCDWCGGQYRWFGVGYWQRGPCELVLQRGQRVPLFTEGRMVNE